MAAKGRWPLAIAILRTYMIPTTLPSGACRHHYIIVCQRSRGVYYVALVKVYSVVLFDGHRRCRVSGGAQWCCKWRTYALMCWCHH